MYYNKQIPIKNIYMQHVFREIWTHGHSHETKFVPLCLKRLKQSKNLKLDKLFL